MKNPSHLVPPTVSARARPLDRSKSVWRKILPSGAFGPRGFLLFILGLVWIGPAWGDLRFLWAIAGWDAMALVVWACDFAQLPSPGDIDVGLIWSAAATTPTGSSLV